MFSNTVLYVCQSVLPDDVPLKISHGHHHEIKLSPTHLGSWVAADDDHKLTPVTRPHFHVLEELLELGSLSRQDSLLLCHRLLCHLHDLHLRRGRLDERLHHQGGIALGLAGEVGRLHHVVA